MDENNNAGDHQWLKFGILAGILLIVVLVIALLRPVIFGRIVPAVMGDDGTTTVEETVVEETVVDETTAEEAPAETNTDAPVDETDTTDSTVETEAPVNEEETTTETPDEESGESVDNEETAVSTITYTVKPGDTIYSIAREHSVNPAAIVATNNIADPNNILIGTELQIPQP